MIIVSNSNHNNESGNKIILELGEKLKGSYKRVEDKERNMDYTKTLNDRYEILQRLKKINTAEALIVILEIAKWDPGDWAGCSENRTSFYKSGGNDIRIAALEILAKRATLEILPELEKLISSERHGYCSGEDHDFRGGKESCDYCQTIRQVIEHTITEIRQRNLQGK